jgi:hypothetical protein
MRVEQLHERRPKPRHVVSTKVLAMNVLWLYGLRNSAHGAFLASCPLVFDGQRAIAPIHRAADVLALADLDCGAMGGDIPGFNVVPRGPFSACNGDSS